MPLIIKYIRQVLQKPIKTKKKNNNQCHDYQVLKMYINKDINILLTTIAAPK